MSDCATFFREVGPDTDSMSGPNATLKVDRTLGCFGKSPQKKGWWNDWCVGVKKQRNDWCIDSITCLSLSNMKKNSYAIIFCWFYIVFLLPTFILTIWNWNFNFCFWIFLAIWQSEKLPKCSLRTYLMLPNRLTSFWGLFRGLNRFLPTVSEK